MATIVENSPPPPPHKYFTFTFQCVAVAAAVNHLRRYFTQWNGFRWVQADELEPAGHQASHPLGNPFDRGFGGSVVGNGERKHRIFGADEIDLMFVAQVCLFFKSLKFG